MTSHRATRRRRRWCRLAVTAGCTVLLITHRPVPAAQVDRVLSLTDGRLAEIRPA